MDFWITIIGLLRRKQVIIPAVVVAAALGGAAYVTTPVSYESSNLLVMTPTEFGGTDSQDPATPAPLTNPMLNFNDSLRTSAGILIEAMNTTDTLQELGVDADTRLVVNDGRTNPDLLGLNGPFLYIVGQSSSPEKAKEVVVRAKELMRRRLVQWQRAVKAPEKTYVSMVDVAAPTAPTADRARAQKLGLAAAVAGFLVTIGIAYALHRRRLRRHVTEPAVEGPTPAAPDGSGSRPQRRAPEVTEADAEHEGTDRPVRAPMTIGSRKP